MGCGGDILSHALEYGLRLTDEQPYFVSGRLHTFTEGRRNDDQAQCRVVFKSGFYLDCRAVQVEVGALNDIAIKVILKDATIKWSIRRPEEVEVFTSSGKRILEKLAGEFGELCPQAASLSSFAPAHPEGQRDALAEGIRRMQGDFLERVTGVRPSWAGDNPKLPSIDTALAIAQILDRLTTSATNNGTPMPYQPEDGQV